MAPPSFATMWSDRVTTMSGPEIEKELGGNLKG